MGHCANCQNSICLCLDALTLRFKITRIQNIQCMLLPKQPQNSTTQAPITPGLPLKNRRRADENCIINIGYKLQYGRGHNVDTMTYDDVTTHVFLPFDTCATSSEDGIEKSVLRNYRLASLDKPHDRRDKSSNPSHPHSHDIFLQCYPRYLTKDDT